MKFKPQILVVEDEPLSQDMLVRRLSSRGMRVATVSDGEACIQWLQSNVPDLILLDVQMPKMTGLEVLAEIRKHFTHDALPVILVTALGESEDVIRGLHAGANDYVVKPINLPVLLARMQVCLRIKYDVSLLMEAERQRVIIKALGESCHQLAQPMQATTMTLESLIHHPPDNGDEMRQQLRQILKWVQEVGDVIHRMQKVGTQRPVPYTERIEMFDTGEGPASPKDKK
ncbi:MAG: response regulator [Anaerolineae bacterium]|nr:response regulator [Phycisphaerae bacterium]